MRAVKFLVDHKNCQNPLVAAVLEFQDGGTAIFLGLLHVCFVGFGTQQRRFDRGYRGDVLMQQPEMAG